MLGWVEMMRFAGTHDYALFSKGGRKAANRAKFPRCSQVWRSLSIQNAGEIHLAQRAILQRSNCFFTTGAPFARCSAAWIIRLSGRSDSRNLAANRLAPNPRHRPCLGGKI